MDRLALAVTGKFNKIGPQRSCPCAHLLHKGQQFGAFAPDAQYFLPRAEPCEEFGKLARHGQLSRALGGGIVNPGGCASGWI